MRKLFLISSIIGSLFTLNCFAEIVPPAYAMPLINETTLKGIAYSGPQGAGGIVIGKNGYIDLKKVNAKMNYSSNMLYIKTWHPNTKNYSEIAFIVYKLTNRAEIMWIANENADFAVSTPDNYTLAISNNKSTREFR